MAVTDPLPAGFEPVESWFATTAAALGAKQDDQGDARATGRRWWQRGGFDHVERHDDRVQLFATRLSEGRHEFSYVVRATTAGTFRTAPARAEEMYEPEVFGRTATTVIEVQEVSGPWRVRRDTLIRACIRARTAAPQSGAVVTAWRLARCGSGSGPIPPELLDLSDATSTVVVDRHGVPLYEALSGDGHAQHPARRRAPAAASWWRPRSPPRIAASTATPASIRWRSSAR